MHLLEGILGKSVKEIKSKEPLSIEMCGLFGLRKYELPSDIQ